MPFHFFGKMSLPKTVYFSISNFDTNDPAYCTLYDYTYIHTIPCMSRKIIHFNIKKVGIECVFHWFLLFSYINPLTPVNEMFADFRETSSTCFSWYAEFRTFRIFKISLAVPNLCEMLVFWVF